MEYLKVTAKAVLFDLVKRARHIVIAVDQVFGTIITLGKSYPDETPSSYAWRLELKGHRMGVFIRPKIDALFFFLFRQVSHCQKSYMEERRRSHVAPEFRDDLDDNSDDYNWIKKS